MNENISRNLRVLGSVDIDTLSIKTESLDLGFRRPVTQSSTLSSQTHASSLYPSNTPGSWFFQTDLEDNPYLIVDLERVCNVGTIRLWNREDAGLAIKERATPFKIFSSADRESWTKLVEWAGVFGGRIDKRPFSVTFFAGLNARYIKIELLSRNYLHLDYVEILQFLPKTDWGYYSNLVNNVSSAMCEYIHTFNTGFFSGCSTALHDFIKLAKCGIAVRRLDFTKSFLYFKDDCNSDVFPLLFDYDERVVGCGDFMKACRDVDFDCHDVHGHYCKLPLAAINKVVSTLFSPSRAVQVAVESLKSKTGLDPEQTIVLVYRGTDKKTEVTLAPIDDYIAVAMSIKQKNPKLKVLVQTDQKQARDSVLKAFGGDCIFFDDLPVTSGEIVMHQLSDSERALNRTQFSILLMAAVIISSSCRYAVLHTGNVAAWIAFYRGSCSDIYQFDASGRLLSGTPISNEDICRARRYAAEQENTLFNPKFYLSIYEDIGLSGFDPFDHFVNFGYAEGRRPCPDVELFAYLKLI